jgi:hypothetical protein
MGTSSARFTRLGILGCWVFCHIKGKLMGCRADSASEPVVRIAEILGEIERDTLNAVFRQWRESVQRCIDMDGEYGGCAKET